jgi:hypothetical protein
MKHKRVLCSTDEDPGLLMSSVCNCCMYWWEGGEKGGAVGQWGAQGSKNGAVDSEHGAGKDGDSQLPTRSFHCK